MTTALEEVSKLPVDVHNYTHYPVEVTATVGPDWGGRPSVQVSIKPRQTRLATFLWYIIRALGAFALWYDKLMMGNGR